jgi:aminopeptidase N
MKKSLLVVLILVFIAPLNIYSQVLSQKRGSVLCSQKKSAAAYIKPSPLSPITPKHKFDVLKYTMYLDIYNCFKGNYPNSFNASAIIKFRIDTALSTISLNAVESSLVIDSVDLAAVSFAHNNDILTITLDHTYQPGDTAEVKIKYHHLDVPDHAFYASNGFVFTDCEPEGARKWFPCWDHPSDKALLDLTAKVPYNAKMGSNGALADSVIVGDSVYYHWVSRDPIATYLMVVTARVNYQLDIVYWTNPNSPSSPPTPIRFYYNLGEDPTAMESIIGGVCDFFSEQFCEHPFEKNGFATLSNQFPMGGMENQTLTSLCPNCWYQSVVVHEFAHQWFGDMITCGTWADIFLNEGFATYLESLWLEHSLGYTAYKTDVDTNAYYYHILNPGWAIAQPAWAVTTPPSNQLFNYAITYAKGACVLHQLRYVMGDSLFFAGMKQYASDSLNTQYQSALIADFEAHMEQVYGQPLDWFYNEWLYEPNHPVYSNTYSISNLGGGTWKVGFFTQQTQTNTVFFKMPLQIKVRFTDNTDTIVRAMNDLNGQAFSFWFNKQPNQVTFDPGNDIVLKESSTIVNIDDIHGIPNVFSLSQNHPNPVLDETRILYTLPESTGVVFSLFDINGNKISEINYGKQAAGDHIISLPTVKYNSGVYYYRIEANGFTQTRKMVVTR